MQRIKFIIVGVLLVLMNTFVFGQATTNSPYSKYGIGILRPESFNQNFALGGGGLGLRSATNINFLNPASYSELSITTVEFGFTNNALSMDDGTQKQFKNNSYINHVAFGFPVINNKWGMSFGMLPFSNIGYDYKNTVNDPVAGDIDYYYVGDGGLNKAYFGNALKFNLDSSSVLSVGANASYLFGSFNSFKALVYGDLPNSFNFIETHYRHVSDFSFDGGVQYQKNFKNTKGEKYNLTIGLTYTLPVELNVKTSSLITTFKGPIDYANSNTKDTVLNETDVKEFIQLPSTIGTGIVFTKENKWTALVDFKTSTWSQVNTPANANYTLNSSYTLIGGFEFTPKYDAFNNYFKRIKYRFGARFTKGYLSINNIDINEYGITFGMFLPIKRTDTALPGINLGFEYGGKGKAESGLIQEKYFNINIGITINDRWFIKRKYD